MYVQNSRIHQWTVSSFWNHFVLSPFLNEQLFCFNQYFVFLLLFGHLLVWFHQILFLDWFDESSLHLLLSNHYMSSSSSSRSTSSISQVIWAQVIEWDRFRLLQTSLLHNQVLENSPEELWCTWLGMIWKRTEKNQEGYSAQPADELSTTWE